jgi:hypothetical protein
MQLESSVVAIDVTGHATNGNATLVTEIEALRGPKRRELRRREHRMCSKKSYTCRENVPHDVVINGGQGLGIDLDRRGRRCHLKLIST